MQSLHFVNKADGECGGRGHGKAAGKIDGAVLQMNNTLDEYATANRSPEATHVVNVLHAHIGIHNFAALPIKHSWSITAGKHIDGVFGLKREKLYGLGTDGKLVGLHERGHCRAIPRQGVRYNGTIAQADEETRC